MLELVGLAGFRDRRVASLSGGEQQRVALARALAVSPRLLMLDEPLGALDRQWRARLLDEIHTLLGAAGLAALYVTHDQDEAFAIATRVALIRDGRIVQIGTPAEVWGAPADAWVASFLGFAPVVEAHGHGGEIDTPWGVKVDAGNSGDGAVTVVVRPDGVRLESTGALAARVVRATFTGTSVRIVLRPEAGPRPHLSRRRGRRACGRRRGASSIRARRTVGVSPYGRLTRWPESPRR